MLNYDAPAHPQPSIYETTVVKVGRGKQRRSYDYRDYEAQREMRFGHLDDLSNRSFEALLDKGWVPSQWGFLIDPTKYPNAKRDQEATP